MPHQVNERAVLARDVTSRGIIVKAGERGTIVDVDPDFGHILFKTDRIYPTIPGSILHFDSDEVPSALSPVSPLSAKLLAITEKLTDHKVSHPAILVAVFAVAGIVFFHHGGGEAGASHIVQGPNVTLPSTNTAGLSYKPSIAPYVAPSCSRPLPFPVAPTPATLENLEAVFEI